MILSLATIESTSCSHCKHCTIKYTELYRYLTSWHTEVTRYYPKFRECQEIKCMHRQWIPSPFILRDPQLSFMSGLGRSCGHGSVQTIRGLLACKQRVGDAISVKTLVQRSPGLLCCPCNQEVSAVVQEVQKKRGTHHRLTPEMRAIETYRRNPNNSHKM